MKIERRPDAEQWLVQQTKDWLNRQPRRDGIHVSDLLYPRKAYWKRLDPQLMTDTEAAFFIAGQGHHYIIESIIEGSGKVGKADGGSHEWHGIWYSPDALTPHPLEIKTSRSQYGPKSETERSYRVEYEQYLKQLTAYMAIREDPEGDLLVFYLTLKDQETKRTTPEFRWYHVTLTQAQLGERQAELLATKKALETALKRKKPQGPRPLPGVVVPGLYLEGQVRLRGYKGETENESVSKVYIGIDPGTRNIGLARVWPSAGGEPEPEHVIVDGVDTALRVIRAWVAGALTPTTGAAVIAVEDYGDFGPRRGSFSMLKIIGGVLGLGVVLDIPVKLYMPRDKERVSSQIERPKGMTDHEFDALCLAYLAAKGRDSHKAAPAGRSRPTKVRQTVGGTARANTKV